MPVTDTDSEFDEFLNQLAGRFHAAGEEAAVAGRSGFKLLVADDEAFLVRVLLLAGAQRSVDLQYYLFRGDISGSALTESILQAADRGVRVRLLVDGLSLIGRDYQAAVLNMHPNVELRLFNPVAGHGQGVLARLIGMLGNLQRANRRMHNKVFIVDERWVVLGGRNVGDRYFGVSDDFGFRDVDVVCTGKLVADIRGSFDAYWNSDITKTLRALGVRNLSLAEFGRFRNRLSELLKQKRYAAFREQLVQTALATGLRQVPLEMTWADARLIVDQPDKGFGADAGVSPMEQLVDLANAVSEELLLVSPYFVPGERGMLVLSALRARGVRVVLVTNSLAATDVIAAHAGYQRYRERLLRMGVEIHEIRARPLESERQLFGRGRASLHAKVYVFDRQKVVVGSLNLDPRSMMLNTEIGALIDSEPFAAEVAQCVSVLASAECSYRVRLDISTDALAWQTAPDTMSNNVNVTEPDVGWWRRLAVRLLGLLPIEDQL